MPDMKIVSLAATTVEAGTGAGMALLIRQPLSFWGGYDAGRGEIVEAGHPNAGDRLAGRVMLMARSKGSSSSSSVLAEAIRAGTGPAAIVMREPDLIVALGAIVARELYGMVVPIVVTDAATWDTLSGCNACLNIDAGDDGHARITIVKDSDDDQT